MYGGVDTSFIPTFVFILVKFRGTYIKVIAVTVVVVAAIVVAAVVIVAIIVVAVVAVVVAVVAVVVAVAVTAITRFGIGRGRWCGSCACDERLIARGDMGLGEAVFLILYFVFLGVRVDERHPLSPQELCGPGMGEGKGDES